MCSKMCRRKANSNTLVYQLLKTKWDWIERIGVILYLTPLLIVSDIARVEGRRVIILSKKKGSCISAHLVVGLLNKGNN
jgi:hypothetical protein